MTFGGRIYLLSFVVAIIPSAAPSLRAQTTHPPTQRHPRSNPASLVLDSKLSDISLHFPRTRSRDASEKKQALAKNDAQSHEARETWLFALNSNARNVSLTLFSRPDSRRIATIRVDRVLRDHQKKGFFKIGALPILIAEGAILELHDPSQLQSTLRRLNWTKENRSNSPSATEFRRFELRISAHPEWKLRARTAAFTSQGVLSLTDVALQTESGARFLADGATLDPRGEQRGWLRLSGTKAAFELPGFKSPANTNQTPSP